MRIGKYIRMAIPNLNPLDVVSPPQTHKHTYVNLVPCTLPWESSASQCIDVHWKFHCKKLKLRKVSLPGVGNIEECSQSRMQCNDSSLNCVVCNFLLGACCSCHLDGQAAKRQQCLLWSQSTTIFLQITSKAKAMLLQDFWNQIWHQNEVHLPPHNLSFITKFISVSTDWWIIKTVSIIREFFSFPKCQILIWQRLKCLAARNHLVCAKHENSNQLSFGENTKSK